MTRVLALLALTACGDDGTAGPTDAPATDVLDALDAPAPYVPGAAVAISHGDPGNDEDPAVLRARDGSIYVAWYSQAADNDLLISRTTDGVLWSQPARMTTSPTTNFGPSLYQDAAGTFHAAWFRWTAAPPGKIVYSHSADGVTWPAANEVDVTLGNATDDWVPSISEAPDGALVIAFARNTCPPPNTCYAIDVARSTTHGASWDAPISVMPAGSGLEHHLPALARSGGELVLAWDPFSDTANAPWDGETTGSFVRILHSQTGTTWTNASDLTTAQASSVSLYPTFYADHAGALHVAYLTGNAAATTVVEVPLAAPATTPAALPLPGYSPRIVATPTPGVYLGAYVAGPVNEREVFVRVFDH